MRRAFVQMWRRILEYFSFFFFFFYKIFSPTFVVDWNVTIANARINSSCRAKPPRVAQFRTIITVDQTPVALSRENHASLRTRGRVAPHVIQLNRYYCWRGGREDSPYCFTLISIKCDLVKTIQHEIFLPRIRNADQKLPRCFVEEFKSHWSLTWAAIVFQPRARWVQKSYCALFFSFFFFKLFCDLRLGRVKTVFAENRNKRSCKRMVNDQRIRRLQLE